jgi:hypothetical protein
VPTGRTPGRGPAGRPGHRHVHGATLVLTGDAGNNDFEITQGTDDRLTLTGFGGTQVRLNAGLPLAAVTLPTPTTANAAVFSGAGTDTLTVTGVDFPGPLGVNGGDGASALTLRGGVTVHGGLAVTSPAPASLYPLRAPVRHAEVGRVPRPTWVLTVRTPPPGDWPRAGRPHRRPFAPASR